MLFDSVYPSGRLVDSLEDKCGCKVAFIPFMDCAPNTSYLVSQDGTHVFVSVDFGGYCQVKDVKITPAGTRSANSKPSFMRRNRNGFRVNSSLPAAVYGAFVLRELPRYKLRHIDGNPSNCHVCNLAISDDSIVRKNIELLASLYTEKYKNICKCIMSFRRMPIEDAQDYVSDAFMEMCLHRKPLEVDKAVGLWMFLAKENIITVKARNRIVYDTYHAFQNIEFGGESDDNAIYESVLGLLPVNCKKALSLVLSGYNQREAAQKIGCSQSQICLLLKKSKSILESYDQQS